MKQVHGLFDLYLDIGSLKIIPGGNSRQESVCSALEEMVTEAPELVLIHDGARPWLNTSLIERVVEYTTRYGACVPVVQVSDALKETDKTGIITKHFDRRSVMAAQTPQGFRFHRILEAYREVKRKNLSHFIDDAEIYSYQFGLVSTVAGNPTNRKITFPHDLVIE